MRRPAGPQAFRDWHEVKAAVEEALSALPYQFAHVAPIPPPLVEYYADAYVAAFFQQLRRPPPPRAESEARLAAAVKGLEAAKAALAALQGPEIDAAQGQGLSLGEGERRLHLYAEAMKAAQRSVAGTMTPRGRAPKAFERTIAARAAADFYRITGEAPSLSRNRGQFRDFLRALFVVFGLSASSVDHFAQVGVQSFRERAP